PALPGGVADGAARASVLAPATLEVGLPALAPAVRADDVEGLPGAVPDPGDEAARDAIEAVRDGVEHDERSRPAAERRWSRRDGGRVRDRHGAHVTLRTRATRLG